MLCERHFVLGTTGKKIPRSARVPTWASPTLDNDVINCDVSVIGSPDDALENNLHTERNVRENSGYNNTAAVTLTAFKCVGV